MSSFEKVDAVVVGGGPGGSVFAARLASLGRRVVLVERVHHPRFHLGESLLPASLDVLDTLGLLDEVRATFLVKRGAAFVEGIGGPEARRVRYVFAEAFHAKWDHAFQVPRDVFDQMLLRRAAACGAEVHEGCEATRVVFEGARAVGVETRDESGRERAIAARVVVDASGRDALIARAARSVQRIAHLDRTALYTQVRGAWRDQGDREGDIQIVVFGEGDQRGWFWVIPFRDGRTSVGAVVSGAWIRAHEDLNGPEALFDAAVAEAPAAAEMLQGSERLFRPGATADFSFRVGSRRGDGWMVVGDAGGFIDPLFSTGAHLAMHGSLRGADAVHAALAGSGAEAGVRGDQLAPWEHDVQAGADLFIGAVQAFYAGDLVSYLFAQPQHPFLRRAITSMLSGDVFAGDPAGESTWLREMRSRFPARA
ncbi:MAG TPA: NAD(P)/FAD-dependent oxidoreductase [Polyangiaceae bacterium]|nr:NAD(P)/FAD-dependent oxidoreductase [Polyangiaceae bacterium]